MMRCFGLLGFVVLVVGCQLAGPPIVQSEAPVGASASPSGAPPFMLASTPPEVKMSPEAPVPGQLVTLEVPQLSEPAEVWFMPIDAPREAAPPPYRQGVLVGRVSQSGPLTFVMQDYWAERAVADQARYALRLVYQTAPNTFSIAPAVRTWEVRPYPPPAGRPSSIRTAVCG